MGTTITLLSYKEEENLKILIPKIIENIEKVESDYEILVVDTEKPLDNTATVCEAFGARYVNQKYPGFGGAFKTAIEHAQKKYFLIMDSDGSHNPLYIPSIYKKFINANADVVIGSRYIKGGKTCDTASSIVMSKILNAAFRVCLGIKAHDISTDYRMYYTEQLKQVTLENRNYDVLQEVLLKLKLKKPELEIGEVPIVFTKRIYGESKRQLLPFIVSYIKSLFRLTCMRFPALKNFFLYALIGGMGALIDYSIFSVCVIKEVFPAYANILGALCGFCFTFFMNTFFNFNKRTHILKRLISYGAVCIFGTIISTFCIWQLSKSVSNIYLLKLGLLLIISLLQFALNKRITYKS